MRKSKFHFFTPNLTKSAISEAFAGMHTRKDFSGIYVPVMITTANVSKKTIQYAKDLNVELFLVSDKELLKQAKVTKTIPYGNYGIFFKVLAYKCTKDRVWIDTLPDNKNALSDISIIEKLLKNAECDFNNAQAYMDNADEYERKAREERQKAIDIQKVNVYRALQISGLANDKGAKGGKNGKEQKETPKLVEDSG